MEKREIEKRLAILAQKYDVDIDSPPPPPPFKDGTTKSEIERRIRLLEQKYRRQG